MPLLKLTSMGVNEKTEGDIKPFHDGFCKFRQTRAHFFFFLQDFSHTRPGQLGCDKHCPEC